MINGEDVYEARYGWTARTVVLLLTCLLFTAALLLFDWSGTGRVDGLPVPERLVQVLGLALFGGGAAVVAFNATSAKVALRVDAAGIRLGGSPLRYTATTAFVPWSELTGVELWIQHIHAGPRTVRMPYVGVHRSPGSRPLPGAPKGRGSGLAAGLAGVPAELLHASRAVNGWPLDTARLLATVQRHAPEVAVVVAPGFPASR